MAPGEHHEVLCLGPVGSPSVDPCEPAVHAAPGGVGEAESATVAGVDGEPVVAVGVEPGAERELHERVVRHRGRCHPLG